MDRVPAGLTLISGLGRKREQDPTGQLREAVQLYPPGPPRSIDGCRLCHQPAAMGGRFQGQVKANHRPSLASGGEAKGQDRLGEPRVRGQITFGIRLDHGHRPCGHRAQPSGNLAGLVGRQRWIGKGPTALGSRHRATDDQPVVVVPVALDCGELIAQRAKLDTACMVTQEHCHRMSRALPAVNGAGRVSLGRRAHDLVTARLLRLRTRWERRNDIHEAFLGPAVCLSTHRHVQRLC